MKPYPILDSTNVDNHMVTEGRPIDDLSTDEEEPESRGEKPIYKVTDKGCVNYCPECGCEVTEGDKRCPECDTKLDWEEGE